MTSNTERKVDDLFNQGDRRYAHIQEQKRERRSIDVNAHHKEAILATTSNKKQAEQNVFEASTSRSRTRAKSITPTVTSAKNHWHVNINIANEKAAASANRVDSKKFDANACKEKARTVFVWTREAQSQFHQQLEETAHGRRKHFVFSRVPPHRSAEPRSEGDEHEAFERSVAEVTLYNVQYAQTAVSNPTLMRPDFMTGKGTYLKIATQRLVSYRRSTKTSTQAMISAPRASTIDSGIQMTTATRGEMTTQRSSPLCEPSVPSAVPPLELPDSSPEIRRCTKEGSKNSTESNTKDKQLSMTPFVPRDHMQIVPSMRIKYSGEGELWCGTVASTAFKLNNAWHYAVTNQTPVDESQKSATTRTKQLRSV